MSLSLTVGLGSSGEGDARAASSGQAKTFLGALWGGSNIELELILRLDGGKKRGFWPKFCLPPPSRSLRAASFRSENYTASADTLGGS